MQHHTNPAKVSGITCRGLFPLDTTLAIRGFHFRKVAEKTGGNSQDDDGRISL
ncbi:MAG: hypothetical protein PHD01_19080 [Geobacteraceae bacterium]|nr:hypothetical protein [Geobacteraceae bacterium]